jgi:hypothetical protein
MRLWVIIISVLWLGCQPIIPNNSSTDKFFDLPEFSQKLIESHVVAQSSVIKKTSVNEKEEISNLNITDSLFWATELYPLLVGDLNRPSLIDAFKIEEDIPETTSNLKKIIYTSLPEANTNIQRIEIKYLHTIDEVRYVKAQIHTNNSVYNTEQSIQLWTNRYGKQLFIDSVITFGFNKTILLDSMTYTSKVVVLR